MNARARTTITLFACSLMAGTTAIAQDQSNRDDRTPTTGTKIFKTIHINEVFEPSVILLGASLAGSFATSTSTTISTPVAASETATDITFVLDDSLDIAAAVFEGLPAFRTERVIRKLHSLGEVRDYLARSSETYHTINLVAHGAPQTGLKAGLSNPTERASTQRLLEDESRHDGLIGKINSDTRIRLYSCGVAADHRLLDAVARYFSAGQQSPSVMALNEFIQFRDLPELSVTVKESLTVIAPNRMSARRWVEQEAGRLSIDLPFGWESALDTKPMRLELSLGGVFDASMTPREIAEQSAEIQQELIRLQASGDQFRWNIEDGRLSGQAVIAHLATEPPEAVVALSHPDEANWIADR